MPAVTNRTRGVPRWRLVATTVAVVALAVSCGTSEPQETNASTTDSASEPDVAEFERFAGFPVPADAVVLGIAEEAGIDRYIGVVFEVPADQVDGLLSAAEFSARLDRGFAPSNVVAVDGVELPAGDHVEVSSGQDRHHPADGPSVVRAVGVYVDGDRATLTVAAFTT